MLKYFYKTFSTVILVLALLNLQITPTYAQAKNNEKTEAQKNKSQKEARQAYNESSGSSSAGSSQAEGGEAGGDMASRMMSVTTEDVEFALGDMLVFLMLIGIGVFVLSIWRYQPMSMDMKVAMGASLIMVASILMSIFSTRGDIDAGTYKIEKFEDGTVNNMQVDALKEQRKSYVALRDHAERKWKIEAAGTVAFLASAGIAQMASMNLEAKTKTCMGALTAQACPSALSLHKQEVAARWKTAPSKIKLAQRAATLKARKAALAECVGPAPPKTKATAPGIAAKACLPEGIHLKTSEPASVVADPKQSSLYPASGPDLNIQDFINKAMVAKLDSANLVEIVKIDVIEQIGRAPGLAHLFKNPIPRFQYNTTYTNMAESNLSQKVLDFMIPRSHAFEFNAKMLGLSAGALAAFYFLRKKMVAWMDKWMGNPDHRRNLYLGAAGIAGAATAMSKASLGQAKENIKKIDKILDKLGALQDMSKTQMKKKHQDIGLAAGLAPLEKTPAVKISPNNEGVSCPRPKKNGKCPSLEKDIKTSEGFSSIDPSFSEIAGLVGRAGDSIVGSDQLDGAAMSDIDDLASKNALAKRGLRELEKFTNKKRKGNGKEEVDYDKDAKDFASNLARISKDALSSKGSSPRGLMASMGYRPMDRGEKTDDKVDVTEALREADGVASAKNKGLEDSASDEKFNFDFGEEAPEGEIFEGGLDEYNTDMYAKAFDAQASKGSEQIVGDRDVSIFRVISVRYMKSGMPRLLEELSHSQEENRLEELE